MDTATYGLLIRVDRKDLMVPWTDIVCFEIEDNYIKIFTLNESRPYLTKGCLKDIELLLPSRDFCRVHRSYIVGLRHIRHIYPDLVNLGTREVPLAKVHTPTLKSRFSSIRPLSHSYPF